MSKARNKLLPHAHNWVAWGYDLDPYDRPVSGHVHAYCRSVDARFCETCRGMPCKCARIFSAEQWSHQTERYRSYASDTTRPR